MTNEEAINELLQCYSLYSPFKTAKKTNEAISMAIKALEGMDTDVPANSALDHIHNVVRDDAYRRGHEQGKADAAPQWIPFKTRPLTEEEKEEYPEWDYTLDCELPDDGQRILVNIKYKSHEAVQMDEFYTDDGCYLDSGYEIGTEATAWMPLPEPWKGE